MPTKTIKTKTKGERVQVQIYLSRELYESLKDKAIRDVRRVADAVRHAVQLYVGGEGE